MVSYFVPRLCQWYFCNGKERPVQVLPICEYPRPYSAKILLSTDLALSGSWLWQGGIVTILGAVGDWIAGKCEHLREPASE